MSKVFGIFTDKSGEFSWRKIMTAGCLIVFLTAQIGNLIVNKFAELPTAYWSVDASVFAFYFLKDTLRNVKVTTNEKPA